MESRPFISKLPRAHPPNERHYFVRPCFHRYFEYIKTEFIGGRDQITLTGTPGIGKSIFINYFIEEYFKIDPNIVFFVFAFTKDGFLHDYEGAAVISLKNGVIVCDFIENLFAGGKVFSNILAKIGDNYLVIYDGWSNKGYLNRVKCLCCTSPNYEWYRQNDKARDIWIYMPLWSRDEIENANSALSLGISEESLNKRMDMFGLSVEYVLETDLKYVMKGAEYLENARGMFKSFKQLEPYLKQFGSPYSKPLIDTNAFHSVFHYSVPSADLDIDKFDPESYVMVVSSEKTKKKLEELVAQLRETERGIFVSLISRSTKTAPLIE
jgi:GTPase SAR1 family protein